MKLNIAVIDDVEHDLEAAVNMVQRYFRHYDNFSASVSGFDNGESFFTAHKEMAFQIVLLDICMNGMDGLTISQKLRSMDENIVIIFMSTTTEYVFETFKALPHGYLRKPFSFEEFCETMDRATARFTRSPHIVTVKLPRREESMNADEIVSAYSDNHNTIIRLIGGEEIRTISTFTEIAGLLLDIDGFVECNRGIIINSNFILSQIGSDVKMNDGTVYPVRRKDRKLIADLLVKNLSRKMEGGFLS